MNERLQPALRIDGLFSGGAAFMARTSLEQTRMLGYTPLLQELVTTPFIGLLNGCGAVRHESACGTECLELMERAGLEVDEDLRSYRTGPEAEAHADAFIAEGRRLFWPYPMPKGRFPEAGQVVSTSLYRRLNAKPNLADFVPAAHVPQRRVVGLDAARAEGFQCPVYLKVAGDAATGWGYSVRPCADPASFASALDWVEAESGPSGRVIIEEWVAVTACWCAGLAISAEQVHCFGGAEQLFDAPATQSGSVVDVDLPFPPEGKILAERVGEVARTLGYTGIAGMDIGLAEDGRLLVFDLNFRLNGSTAQLLLHEAAARRAGLPVSLSAQVRSGGRFCDLSPKVGAAIDAQWFVPTRLVNAEKLALAQGKHFVTGFVLGADRDAASARVRDLQRLLE